MYYKDIVQGQLGWVSLNPTKGHEQGGKRPVLILSNNEFNRRNGGMIKVAPITTNMKEFPLHVKLPDGLPIKGKVLLEHERAIDLTARKFEPEGKVSNSFLNKVIKIVKMTY
ncbi:type II toxin-antitoxin system PemK/MazF family toxin [Ligilactobacillus saerimneri]|uniref:mRNA interferase n=1 Tax=Ligilactobacillus saerimneri TaxID=228229 RepID=A0A7H9EJL1_9LACO|nr:type II toxin-antitoxin system PemK/MazF family toxin [Ligilactobacillus saerimneri]QLL77639.1 type II toxin-antitoxin system PemK/MazF family toxin [Ligilactobacillus saerimneri]